MFEEIIDFEKAKFDDNGILVVNNKEQIDQKARESVNNCDLDKLLKRKQDDFAASKLADHWAYVAPTAVFNDRTVYLEIGCWPAYIGEYLMVNFDSYFIGVDFNYARLQALKRYFEKKGYKKYLLICADINYIPIKDNSVDYIYGGGVIEHLKNTPRIINEIFRVLKFGGVSYNTVPALNFWWLTRFYNTVPDLPLVKDLFEIAIFKIFKGKVMEKHHGYQQAFTQSRLKKLHAAAGFKDIVAGPFAFHPSSGKLRSKILRDLAYKIRQFSPLTAIYFVYAKK